MKDYRSDNFNYFSKEDQIKKQKKSLWKKIWFWLKIVLYVMLFGFSLTGCIQSCVIKTSNYTGGGIEFYTSKDNVSPHVTTFKANNALSKSEIEKLKSDGVDTTQFNFEQNNVLGFKEHQSANFNLSRRLYGNVLTDIQKQTVEYNGVYGAYKNINTALQLFDTNNQIIGGEQQAVYNKNNKYIFATVPVETDEKTVIGFKYESIYNPGELKEWSYIDPGFNFDSYFVYDKADNKYKLNLSAYADDKTNTGILLSGKFKDKITVGSGKTARDVQFDKELSTLTVADNNYYYNAGVNSDQYGLGKFRRDIFEALATSTFYSENSSFYTKAIEEAKTEYGVNNYSELSKYVVAQVTSKDKTKMQTLALSPTIYVALKKYTENISHYINRTGFVAENQINPVKIQLVNQFDEALKNYNDQLNIVNNAQVAYDSLKTPENKKVLDEAVAKLNGYKKLLEGANSSLSQNLTITSPAPGSIMTVKQSLLSNMPLNSEPQRVIYDWGTAWKLGPFYGLFVWPLAYISSALTTAIPIWSGWGTIIAILVITIVLRALMLGVTFKSTVNQSKQEELKSKKAKIDAKYAEFKNNKQMKARQQAEIAELYKKNGINPLDAFATMIISLPVFLAIWRVIQALPDMKSTVWLGMSFAETSWQRLFFHTEWPYLGLLIVVGIVQGISQFLPKLLTMKKFKERTNLEEAKALKKQNKTQTIMSLLFFFITFIFSAGVQIYWIISGLWTIGQTLGIHYFKKTAYYRRKYLQKESKI
ncbi:membrane protein insertase YidC [Mycoplasmopsis felifaucium]|uniref:membrane protein insertase YidC n=1 Tax=Mycoplasmopsis felifaucium TaxID=35768 RepID=UPI0004874786|nr:membrane protein insertase YidC [Mycoplasmopsis felifaucium]